MACSNCTKKYISCSGVAFYNTTVTYTTTAETVTLPTCFGKVRNRGVVGIYVPSQATTATVPVTLTDANGATAPLYVTTTGSQASASDLPAGTTHLMTYDRFSNSFFVTA